MMLSVSHFELSNISCHSPRKLCMAQSIEWPASPPPPQSVGVLHVSHRTSSPTLMLVLVLCLASYHSFCSSCARCEVEVENVNCMYYTYANSYYLDVLLHQPGQPFATCLLHCLVLVSAGWCSPSSLLLVGASRKGGSSLYCFLLMFYMQRAHCWCDDPSYDEPSSLKCLIKVLYRSIWLGMVCNCHSILSVC